MIACIFTIDYEIYGNGEGDLHELVLDPMSRLLCLFDAWNAKIVNFVEVAEFLKIEEYRTDPAVTDVRAQVRSMFQHDHEVALHLHPQWFNARYAEGAWHLDYSEYNLCVLPMERIDTIIGQAIGYLRDVVGEQSYSPFSFRAGNWLFQPTAGAAAVLARHGVRIDSSVYRGGRQRYHGLDYRPALVNEEFWRFRADVNQADERGSILEIPIYTKQVPFWRMITRKRFEMQRKGGGAGRTHKQRLCRALDLIRTHHPLKLDFCRMTLQELKTMMDEILLQDRRTPDEFRPIVLIGHTKDLTDFETIERFLAYLRDKGIEITTLEHAYERCVAVIDQSALGA